MSLRRRLALAYGGVTAAILVVALGLAYLTHVSGHDRDVDSALDAIATHAVQEVSDEIEFGTPLELVTLSNVHRAIDEPIGILLFSGAQLVARGGAADMLRLSQGSLADLPAGWGTSWVQGTRTRTYVLPISGDLRLVAAADLADIDEVNEQLRWTLFLIGALGVGVGMAVAYEIAGYALRPIATLTRTAGEIATTRDFGRRVGVGVETDGEDELTVLGRTFDEMLTSLEGAHQQQRAFLNDVSHELRTPLTTIRGNVELLATDACAAQHAEEVAQISRETDRLARLVDDLLVLARSDAVEPVTGRAVQLDEVLMEVFEELRARAPSRILVRWIEATRVLGERDRLKQLVVALVDNAIRYTPAPGRIELSLERDAGDALLRVADEGIGLPRVPRERLFERFYRGDEARRLDASGSGLGLAIVRWIVRRHGGDIELEPNEPRGTRATVRLPLA